MKSDSGRGPVWLRELRILCKLCKLWTERRSSKSSRVDLKALITRSCKNREGCSIRRQGSKLVTHKHAVSITLYIFISLSEFFKNANVNLIQISAFIIVHICISNICNSKGSRNYLQAIVTDTHIPLTYKYLKKNHPCTSWSFLALTMSNSNDFFWKNLLVSRVR